MGELSTLLKSGARFCFGIDEWSAINNVSYIAITVTFIDSSGKYHRRLLRFKGVPLPPALVDAARDNMIGAAELMRIIDDTFRPLYPPNGNLGNVAAVSTSDTCSTALAVLKDTFPWMRGFCMCHITHLIIKDGVDTTRPLVACPPLVEIIVLLKSVSLGGLNSTCTLAFCAPHRYHHASLRAGHLQVLRVQQGRAQVQGHLDRRFPGRPALDARLRRRYAVAVPLSPHSALHGDVARPGHDDRDRAPVLRDRVEHEEARYWSHRQGPAM
jgi:hypothetical protein